MSRLKNLRRRLSVLTASACCMMLPSAVTLGGEGATIRSLTSDGITYAPSSVSRSLNSNQGPSLTKDSLEFETSAPPMSNRSGYPVSTQLVDPVAQPQPMQFEQPNYHVGSGHSMPADCCMGCDRSFYAIYDSLWMRRTGDQGFTLTAGQRNQEFGYDWTGRYTIGQMFDCVDGVEAVYTGPLSWQVGSVKATALNPATALVAGGGIAAGNIAAFNNGTLQADRWNAKFQSLEFNRRWFANDVLSSLFGIRSIEYDEDYLLRSQSALDTGVYTWKTDNLLTGIQVGLDLSYPLSQRMSYGSRLRGGVYANFNQGRAILGTVNNGVLANNFDEDVDVAGMIEYGTTLRYRLFDAAVVTAGYEMWYMPGVASVPGQRLYAVNPNLGSKVVAKDDVFFHGATAGLEISF